MWYIYSLWHVQLKEEAPKTSWPLPNMAMHVAVAVMTPVPHVTEHCDVLPRTHRYVTQACCWHRVVVLAQFPQAA